MSREPMKNNLEYGELMAGELLSDCSPQCRSLDIPKPGKNKRGLKFPHTQQRPSPMQPGASATNPHENVGAGCEPRRLTYCTGVEPLYYISSC